jgi:hypothetical protein
MDGFHNVGYQIDEFSAMCAGILEKVVHSPQQRHERPLRRNVNLEETQKMVQRNPITSVRRISDGVGVIRMQVWRTLHDFGLYPLSRASCRLYDQLITLHAWSSCHWLLESQQLHTKNLFTDEAMFNTDGMTNTRSSHVWSLDNTHAYTETHFQSRFPVNILCGVTGSQAIGPFVLRQCLTSKDPSFSLKMSYQCHHKMFLCTSGEICSCNKTAYPLVSIGS